MNEIYDKAAKIKLIIFDIDGIFTDGKLYYSNDGNELKTFDIQDGLGVKMLQWGDIDSAIITGRDSPTVQNRMSELGVKHIYLNQTDKNESFNNLIQQLNLNLEQVAYMGDDLPDVALMQKVGLSITTPNANYFVKNYADWQTQCHGGNGAVREAIEMLLTAQNKLEEIQQRFLAS